MEVDWVRAQLSERFLASPEFRNAAISVLETIWPVDGVTKLWAEYYDTWHRHLIPLSDFMMSPEEAVERFGLLHFSADEGPQQLEIYFHDQEKEHRRALRFLEDKIKTLTREIESLKAEGQHTVYEELKLRDALLERDNLLADDFDLRIRNAYQDAELRTSFLRAVGNRKDDPRRYVMIHHCFDHAKVVYLMAQELFPQEKWGVIMAPNHALITTATPQQLETYLFHDQTATDFWIAEPVVSGRDAIANLMKYPEQWQWITDKQDIFSTSVE